MIDTSVSPASEKRFQTYNGLVQYLEGVTQRVYKQTRKQRMIMLEELGHGYDDPNSITFVRTMASGIEMGIIRNEAGVDRRIKCDITSVSLFQKEEFGD